MSVRIDSLSKIERRLGVEPNGPVQAFLTSTCAKHMDKYIPQRDGNLRTNVILKTDSITYATPYASYQYYGVRRDGTHKVSHYTTPGTGPYWDKRMISAEIQTVVREVKDYMRR